MTTDGNSQVVVKVEKRGRPRIHPYPSELTCSITGVKVKTNPIQFKKLMEKSGKTVNEIVATYVSRAGKKQLALAQKVAEAPAPVTSVAVESTPAATAVEETKSEENAGGEPAPDGPSQGRGALVTTKVVSPLPETNPCWYPNRYLDNFHCCITCDHLPICGCPLSFEWKGKKTNDKIKTNRKK